MSSKNQTIQIRVSAHEKNAIQQAAQRADMDMSHWALSQLLPKGTRQFEELMQLLAKAPQNRRYILAELNDLLTQLDKNELSDIMAAPLVVKLDNYIANYIAAMIETSAHQLGIPILGWPLSIQPLQNPVFVSEFISLRLHLLTHSPPAFRRRNIFIDASIGDRI